MVNNPYPFVSRFVVAPGDVLDRDAFYDIDDLSADLENIQERGLPLMESVRSSAFGNTRAYLSETAKAIEEGTGASLLAKYLLPFVPWLLRRRVLVELATEQFSKVASRLDDAWFETYRAGALLFLCERVPAESARIMLLKYVTDLDERMALEHDCYWLRELIELHAAAKATKVPKVVAEAVAEVVAQVVQKAGATT